MTEKTKQYLCPKRGGSMNIVIMNSSEKPIYEQIREQLIEQILNGTIQEGKQLPSIRGLAKELQVSVITTKRAYEELEMSGFINTVPGKGSFVSQGNKKHLEQKQIDSIKNQVRQLVSDSQKYNISGEQLIKWIQQFNREG